MEPDKPINSPHSNPKPSPSKTLPSLNLPSPTMLKSVHSPHYTLDKFFRYVNNYDYCFRTFAKMRWLKRPLIEVFAREFKAFTESYYRKAMEKHKILVNGKPVEPDYIIQ